VILIGEHRYLLQMCRSIVRLRDHDEIVSDEEIRAAALQFVRKISGYRKPSAANEEAFNRAVDEIAHSSQHLLEAVVAGLPGHRHSETAA
jgi:hypothetical protein